VGDRSEADTNENRKLQTTLKLVGSSCKLWPKKINGWFNDSIPYRSKVIDHYRYIWENCFMASVGGRYQGENGEFFPDIKATPEVQRFLGLLPLPFERLRATKYAIASTQALCQLNGVPYMFFSFPISPLFINLILLLTYRPEEAHGLLSRGGIVGEGKY
jgi:hypothetical protein